MNTYVILVNNLMYYLFLQFFIGVQLIYNVVLVSVIQQSDSVIQTHTHTHTYTHTHTFFRLFSHIGHYRILNRVSHAIQQIFISYLFYVQQGIHIWRRQWHPTPVLLPGKSHGRRSLVGCSPWGLEELDMIERLHFHFSLLCIGEGNGNPLQCSCLENPRDGGAWWAAVCGGAQSRT